MVQQMHKGLVPGLPIVALFFLQVQDEGLVAPWFGFLCALLLKSLGKGNALLGIHHAVLRTVVEEDLCTQGTYVVGGVVGGLPAQGEVFVAAVMVDDEGIVGIEAGIVVTGNTDGIRKGCRQCFCHEHGAPCTGGYAQEYVVASEFKGTKPVLDMRHKGIDEPGKEQAAPVIGPSFGKVSMGVDAFSGFGYKDAVTQCRCRIEKGGAAGRIGTHHVPTGQEKDVAFNAHLFRWPNDAQRNLFLRMRSTCAKHEKSQAPCFFHIKTESI